MSAYYNEYDPFASAWLQNLADAGRIAPGRIDARSIKDVAPGDIGSGQAHFFAGIGVWSYALKLAGWPDEVPVWTGSCPCQPFSEAGRGQGTSDERHLWPDFFRLIRQCRPKCVLMEQVASKSALSWLDAVSADLEGEGYAVGAIDVPACGVGAPHIRNRLWIVGLADDDDEAGWREQWSARLRAYRDAPQRHDVDGRGQDGGRNVANAERDGRGQGRLGGAHGRPEIEPDRHGAVGLVGNPGSGGGGRNGRAVPCSEGEGERERGQSRSLVDQPQSSSDPFNPWRDPDWVWCTDGKWRPAEPGTFPLSHGTPARVGKLRALGNALVGPVAATFVEAVMEIAFDVQARDHA